MALFAIFMGSIVRQATFYAFIFGSILTGRLINFSVTGELSTAIIVAMVAEAIVIALHLAINSIEEHYYRNNLMSSNTITMIFFLFEIYFFI